jgi:hypothetical protein
MMWRIIAGLLSLWHLDDFKALIDSAHARNIRISGPALITRPMSIPGSKLGA